MTFDSFETSVEGASPVEVFEFTAGAQSFFLTSDAEDVVVAAQTYTAVAGLSRGSTAEGPTKREHDFEITLPTVQAVAQLFVGQMPGVRVRVQVRKFHRDDLPTPEIVLLFDGFIQSASFGRDFLETTFTAKPELAAIGRQVPRRTYMSSCNHVLYEAATCQVDDTLPAFRAAALTVSSQVGDVLTVAAGISGVYPDGFMDSGMVEIVGGADFRLILGQVGNVLTLHTPFASEPSLVNAYAGCGHSIAVCKSKFDNVNRFGGFAFVPTRNPFENGIL